MQNNLCLYCGGEGYKVMTCTAKPPMQMQLWQTSFDQLEGLEEPKNK